MRVHHLNCGSLREIEPLDASERVLRMVCHCLLIETPASGLVLVEAGIGLADVAEPERRLGADWVALVGAALDPAETAIRQIERLGFAPADVRHIVLTHLDLDHAGGLSDFPAAKVHVDHAELHAALTSHNEMRYRAAQWAHGPTWRTYAATQGDRWFGFEAVRDLEGVRDEIMLIPLAGHTRGHSAVAVHTGSSWLLHAGDAYFHHAEIDPLETRVHPLAELIAESAEVDHELRLANVARLRELAGSHGADVEITSAHDPWELQRYAEPVTSHRRRSSTRRYRDRRIA